MAAEARAPAPRRDPRGPGQGEPAAGYPWPWSVYRWLEGRNPTVGPDGGSPGAGRTAEPVLLAADLAGFVAALHRVDPTDGPPSYRSEPLAARDASTRAAIGELHGTIDADAAVAVWEAALRAPSGPARASGSTRICNRGTC